MIIRVNDTSDSVRSYIGRRDSWAGRDQATPCFLCLHCGSFQARLPASVYSVLLAFSLRNQFWEWAGHSLHGKTRKTLTTWFIFTPAGKKGFHSGEEEERFRFYLDGPPYTFFYALFCKARNAHFAKGQKKYFWLDQFTYIQAWLETLDHFL